MEDKERREFGDVLSLIDEDERYEEDKEYTVDPWPAYINSRESSSIK
jgi:hypothetical protein